MLRRMLRPAHVEAQLSRAFELQAVGADIALARFDVFGNDDRSGDIRTGILARRPNDLRQNAEIDFRATRDNLFANSRWHGYGIDWMLLALFPSPWNLSDGGGQRAGVNFRRTADHADH